MLYTPTSYELCLKHTRWKSHSITIPFALVSPRPTRPPPSKAISNPGQKYEVQLKQDKVLTGTKGLSSIPGYV